MSEQIVARMARHWLRVLDTAEAHAARDHILQTMLLAARSAATWSLAARLALRLHPAILCEGLYATWARVLLEVLARAPAADTTLALQLRVTLGATLIAAAEWDRAEMELVRVQRAYRVRGDAWGLARVNYELACLAWQRGAWRSSVRLARAAIRRLAGARAPTGAVRHLHSRLLDLIGLAFWRMEQPARALSCLRRALALRSRADRRGLGHLHHHLMLALTSLNRVDAALAHAADARALFETCADREGLAYLYSDVSDVYRLQNDLTRARAALTQAYALWRELQDPAGLADFYRHLGLLEEQAGQDELARVHLAYARALWERLGETYEMARCEAALGAVSARMARAERVAAR